MSLCATLVGPGFYPGIVMSLKILAALTFEGAGSRLL
jgi:hypothetical protein